MPEYPIETKRFYRGYEVPAKHVKNRHAAAFADGVDAVLTDRPQRWVDNNTIATPIDPALLPGYNGPHERPTTINYGDPEPDRSQPVIDKDGDTWEYQAGAGWCFCGTPRAHGWLWSEIEPDWFPFRAVTG